MKMRLIDADALKKSAVDVQTTTYEKDGHKTIIYTRASKGVTVEDIDKTHTMEAEPVRNGRWEYLLVEGSRSCSITSKIRCPVCHFTFPRLTGYNFKRCPECGAKMDGGTEKQTPEEIKKGLEHCENNGACISFHYDKSDFPQCIVRLHEDALAYIQQLESNDSQVKKALSDNGFASLEAFLQAYSQVKAERDAALSELPHNCWNCKYHKNKPIEETDDNGRTIYRYCDADCCFPEEENSSWFWRGVCDENTTGDKDTR